MGIYPPNIFQDRIRHLKFDERDEWMGGTTGLQLRSNPMALLDGKLIAKDVRIGATFPGSDGYATVLVGYLGAAAMASMP